MLYLIGGAPRAGKTTLAQKLLESVGSPFVSTDLIVHMLKDVAPKLGVTDAVPLREKSKRFYPYLEVFSAYADFSLERYTIEGDAITPLVARKLMKKFPVKACFLGFSQVGLQDIKKYSGRNDWVNYMSIEEQRGLPQRIIDISLEVQKQCKKHGFAFFDLSIDYKETMKVALNYLLAE